MKHAPLVLGSALGCVLAGCAPKPAPVPAKDPADTCLAAPGQALIGHTANALAGAELMRATQSREIRWVAPGMVVTTDYKFGRLTVGYDAALRIVSVTCS